ncbi:MAG: divergent polysaccharide deacetylase family protein, partial [Candidatus Omnitrophica bacterium]|nr:divergent polysaccharide deacetylase family protein [Candidatus Omnitrophota bacterium]
QLLELKNKAKAYGKAIGIGHNHKLTLEVLRDFIPATEKEGYRFVFVSDLVK